MSGMMTLLQLSIASTSTDHIPFISTGAPASAALEIRAEE
jgi:hypothetical protein